MSTTLDPRKAFEVKLVELAKENKNIVALSCDSAAGGGLGSFFKEFPERSVEIGISEQNAVSIAAAMSKQGLIPVLVIINPFLTMRAYEQVRDDLGYMNTNVKIVGSGGGLAYSTLGSTHIAVEDVALMRTVPHLTILSPGDADEVEAMLEQAIAIDGPVYIRMPRQARELPLPTEARKIKVGETEVMRDGKDVAIFAYGPSVSEAMAASKLLEEQGISAAVLNPISLAPLDEKTILDYAKKCKLVCTVEEHIKLGGLGSAVAEVLAEAGNCARLKRFGLDMGSKQTGPYPELVDYYGLSGKKLAESIKEELK